MTFLRDRLAEQPIAVTGMGVLSAAGGNPYELWENVVHGRCPAEWRSFDSPSLPEKVAVCAVSECFAEYQ